MAEVPDETMTRPADIAVRSAPSAEGILPVVRTWATAWLDGDKEAMFACLHPHLAKHILGHETPASPEFLQRIIGVQALLGKAVHDPLSETAVWVLDVQGRSGSARVDLGPWTAFIHLAAHNNHWAIANVLWEWRS
jgi:hypothetical protein